MRPPPPFKCEGVIRAIRKVYVKSFTRTRKTEVGLGILANVRLHTGPSYCFLLDISIIRRGVKEAFGI